jgi:hypothetical protein
MLNPLIPGRNVEEFLLPLRGKHHLLLHLTDEKRDIRGAKILTKYIPITSRFTGRDN